METRFLRSLKQIWSNGSIPSKIAVSLSGGVDSMCLIHLLNKVNQLENLNISIYPISMDHGLRKESSNELKFIHHEMEKLGLDSNFQSCKLDLSSLYTSNTDSTSISFEKLARIKRYDKLHEICNHLQIQNIFTGHHADDNLETFVLRLLNNSGEFGLRGISKISNAPLLSKPFISFNQLKLIRPLLDFNKFEIYKYANEQNTNWVEDYTNNEMIAKRNIIRKYLKENKETSKVLQETQHEVINLTNQIEIKVNNLYHKLQNQGTITQNLNSLNIELDQEIINSNSNIIIARLLFKLAYPYSPMLHYHYRFTKFLDHIPNLLKQENFTLMSLKWESKSIKSKNPDNKGIKIKIKRQVESQNEPLEIIIPPNSKTNWILFDNIYWFKFQNNESQSKSFKIRRVTKNDLFLKKQLGIKSLSNYENLPIIYDLKKGEFQLPTVSPNPEINWKFKQNIFEF
ncbi:tRNA(Ile)-lysidine synthase [Wickerhamomyces ciferrii]|uniref:tRNA(Ile)-lysidine synthetase n=1 Tax=Wickerhamomyces ciferrii (strain ATCC 14091 / BCRC 22168 / CBS 111 / JCM 3599 / NBRC 0793 / NRRL Y-1031 F-60-10) TaxID=1206466 RepID=K0KZ19_WICCF|nr:tRNA(Ile)-lysidine synthase [Wickerhamomyces ciferrii]CCH46629.1 tRNA(Ile)-lysidine synthase [Wickerhamomyces ciferrii]